MNIKDLPLPKLKEIAKKAGAKGYSKLSKSALIEHLRKHASSSMSGGGTSDIATAKGVGSSDTDVSDRLKKLVSHIKGTGVKERCWDGYKEVPGKEPYSKGSCAKGKGVSEEDPIDWDDIKWGSFSEQLRRYNETHTKKFEGDKALCNFAEMILNNKSKFSTTTKRRAMFYKNVLAKKKCS